MKPTRFPSKFVCLPFASTTGACKHACLYAVGFGLSMCAVPLVRAQTAPPQDRAAIVATGEQTIRLPSFIVSTDRDKGYLASNSVSASRIDTPILDLPFAVSAFTPQFMTDIGSRDLSDVVTFSAGVRSGATEFQSGNTAYIIRGFSQAPQHDGFYESSQGNIYVDTAVIERVEVVKGPASLLYGPISPGGTVNYITKQPADTPFVTVTAGGGSYNSERVTIDLNQPLIGNTLLFRFNGVWENGIQYEDPSKTRTIVINPKVVWKLAKNLSLTASFQKFERRENPPAILLPNMELDTPQDMVRSMNGTLGYPSLGSALVNQLGVDVAAGYPDSSDPGLLGIYPGVPFNFNYSSDNDYRKTDLETVNIEADATLNEHWIARVNFDYNKNSSEQAGTGNSTLSIATPGSMIYNGNGTWSVSPSWNALSSTAQIAAELACAEQVNANPAVALGSNEPVLINRRTRLSIFRGFNYIVQPEIAGSYKFTWGELKPLAGLFYNRNYANIQITQDFGNAASPNFRVWDVNPTSPTYYIDHTTYFDPSTLPLNAVNQLGFSSQAAAYGCINGSLFNDRLNFVAGIRYNSVESQTENYNSSSNPFGTGYKAHYSTPQGGVGYKVTPNMTLYASCSESFSYSNTYLSNIVTLPDGTLASVPTSAAKPVIGEGNEAGVKTDFLNGRISSTLSLYEINQTNVVQTIHTVSPQGVTLSTNIQGTAVRSRGVDWEITYSPTNNWQVFASVSEDDIRNTKEPVGYLYYLGAHPYCTAKTLANLWTRYTFTKIPVKGLWVGGGFNYSGKSAGNTSNADLFLPSYLLWSAAIGYDWTWGKTKMAAVLNGQNLSNIRYFPTIQEPGLPRRITLSMTARF